MPRPWQFQLPTRVLFGSGSLRRLGEVVRQSGPSAILVGYRDSPALDDDFARAIRSMEKSGIAVAPFRQVNRDPGVELLAIDEARLAKEFKAEVVVAIGGGSVIDTAKGIAALSHTDGELWDHADANRQSRPVNTALPVVAVPTTAGTGSEVSSLAVFDFRENDLPFKATVYGPAILPRVAIVDPELAVGSPPHLTAACGADALGHAIEAFISRQSNPISSLLAAQAVRLIAENLPRAVENPENLGPRESLALAATLAGAAFNEAGVTVTHALAHGLGAVLNVPHAVAVAIGTPLNLRFNAEVCVAQYAELADVLRLPGDTPQSRAARFMETISQLLRSVGLPDRVSVPSEAPEDLLDRLVESAKRGTSVAITLNPRKVDGESLRQLFAEVLGG